MLLIRSILAGIIFLLLFYYSDFSKVVAAFSHITLISVVYLLIITVILLWLSIFKWKIIVESFGTKNSLLKLSKLYLVGYFVNTFLPSSIGGDVHRSWKLGEEIGTVNSFAATILERITGLFAMLSLAFCCIWSNEVSSGIKLIVSLAFLSFNILLVLFSSASLLSKVSDFFSLSEKLTLKMSKIQQGVVLSMKNKGLLIKALLLSYLFHLGAVINTQICGYVVGWNNSDFFHLLTVVPIILVIGGIPITPGNLGITEGAFYFFLKIVGATSEQALGIPLILRAKSLLLGLIGGLIWVLDGGSNKKCK